MKRDSNTLLSRIKRERTAVIGFLCGSLFFLLLANHTLGWLLPFEYSGDSYNEKINLESAHRSRLDVLSGLATIVGGFIGALSAVDLQRNGWRFSLRTLLIATTLVAVALGIVVAAR